MPNVSEKEFDRFVLQRRVIARTYLLHALEAEAEGDRERAFKLAERATKALRRIPIKAKRVQTGCKHCGGGTCVNDVRTEIFMGRVHVFQGGPPYCGSCKQPWESATTYYIYETEYEPRCSGSR